jgi:hypothetical protein
VATDCANHVAIEPVLRLQHATCTDATSQCAAWLLGFGLASRRSIRERAHVHESTSTRARGSRRVQQTVRRWRVSLDCGLLGLVREGVLLSTQGQVVSTNTEVLCLYARARSRIVRRIAAA